MAEAKESAEKITWKRPDGTDVPGYAFGDKSKPGVIVLQEWYVELHHELKPKFPELHCGSGGA